MQKRMISGLPLACLLIAGCQNPSATDGVTSDKAQPFSAISAEETLYFGGNEPFWGGDAVGDRLRYTTPENIDGETIDVKRFAGLGGLSFSGDLGGQSFDMVVTDARCSDTMADRTYPFTITLQIGTDTREGCGWTDARPYTETSSP